MSINSFDLQFFELVKSLKQPLTEESISSIRHTLLKLKNPTYYSKHISTHPAASFGYYKNKNINPVLIAVSNMLESLKSSRTLEQKLIDLQTEYSWAYNNYMWYLNLVKTTTISS